MDAKSLDELTKKFLEFMPWLMEKKGGGKSTARLLDVSDDLPNANVRCIETTPGRYDSDYHCHTFLVLPTDSDKYWRLDTIGSYQDLRHWKYEVRKSVAKSLKAYYGEGQ